MLCPPAIVVHVGSLMHDEREGGRERRAKERERGRERRAKERKRGMEVLGGMEREVLGSGKTFFPLSTRPLSHVSGSRPSLVYVTSVRSLSRVLS